MYKLLHTRLFQQHIWSVFMKDNSCNCYMYNTKVVFVIFLEYMDILFCMIIFTFICARLPVY